MAMPPRLLRPSLTILGLCFLAVKAHGRRVLTEANRSNSARSGTNASVGANAGAFTCPDECQECCTAHNFKTFFGGFGVSGEKFKCVHRDPVGYHQQSPAERACGKSSRRSYSRKQAKLECEYLASEKKAKAWRSLASCSRKSKCCCSKADDWTERVCLPLSENSTEATHISDISNQEERYIRLDQMYENRDGVCRTPGNKKQWYQATPHTQFTDKGCCLQVSKRSVVKDRVVCGFEHCTGQDRSCIPKYCNRYEHWTECTQWEMLYYCSSDSGVLQAGQMHKRVSQRLGICFMDRSKPEQLARSHHISLAEVQGLAFSGDECPAGYAETIAGESCQCPVACGS